MALCSACRRNLYSRISLFQASSTRFASTTPQSPQAADIPPPITLTPSQTHASSPGLAQPLSTAEFPSTSTAKSSTTGAAKKDSRIRSSVAGGQELRGVAYLKAKPHIMAQEDEEYPKWLWTLLNESKTNRGESKADLSALTKKQRAKYERKQEKLLAGISKPIPVHEQSKDITEPGDDAITSYKKRQEIVKSSREARRKTIRESNFLKTM